MFRALAVLIVVTFPSFSAPALKGKSDLYYPIKVGDKLVYEFTREGEASIERTITITASEEKEGEWIVTTEHFPAEVSNGKLRISKKGVFQIEMTGTVLEPPVPVLQLPAKVGDTWEVIGIKSIPTHTNKVMGEEEVNVPAGKYKAIRIDTTIPLDPKPITFSYWHAPGVGVVKFASTSGQKEYTQVLKSFTPGK
jgi:hypothetical protein